MGEVLTTHKFLWIPRALLQGEISSRRKPGGRTEGHQRRQRGWSECQGCQEGVGPRRLGEFQVWYGYAFFTIHIYDRDADVKNEAFDPEANPLNVPIVQASLFDTEDPDQHFRLGQAVEKLRDDNIQIIVSGMAVHNLRDLRFASGNPMPYTVSFDEALKDAVTTEPANRQKALADLLHRPDARQAHPTFDHLLPIHVGAGAAGEDAGKRLWTLMGGSMSWAQFRFGEVAE